MGVSLAALNTWHIQLPLTGCVTPFKNPLQLFSPQAVSSPVNQDNLAIRRPDKARDSTNTEQDNTEHGQAEVSNAVRMLWGSAGTDLWASVKWNLSGHTAKPPSRITLHPSILQSQQTQQLVNLISPKIRHPTTLLLLIYTQKHLVVY